jgi:hypothetical protein
MTIQEMLSLVAEPRSAHGLRHQLPDVLIMCLMAIMSGHYGYRAIGRFLKNNRKEFQQTFMLLHGVPTYVTVRSVLQRIDFESFASAFNQWASQYVPMCKKDTKAIDGKAIGSTAVDCHSAYQNFVSLVSVFACQRGIVLSCGKIENNKESEIPKVRQLIAALDVKGELFTVDALHCQKNYRPNCGIGQSLSYAGQG